LRIVVNCRFLTQPITGVQQYALKLSLFLKEHFPGKIDFVSPHGILHDQLAQKIGVKTIGNTKGFFWEQVELPFWLKKEGSPLLINFGNVAPQYYSNQIVTIHDLATLEHPEWFSNKFARAYKFMIPQVVQSAKKVIAVSQFTKNRLVDMLKLNPDKIHVIYNSIESIESDSRSDNHHPYFLSVGSFSGRKNFSTLVKSFLEADIPNYHLKIRGDDDTIYQGENDLKKLAQNSERIFFVQELNYTAYLDLIRNARALINTSIYEGFGMPNLEAMSMGVPVICSDIEVFREVCGKCAQYIDPLNPQAIVTELKRFAEHEDQEVDIKLRKEQAAQFKIENEGKKLVDLISQCLATS
jgi:glycosyltransferase involved in cell wall biosynthesis